MIRYSTSDLKKVLGYDERRDWSKELVRADKLAVNTEAERVDSFDLGTVRGITRYSVYIDYIDWWEFEFKHGMEPADMSLDPRYHCFDPVTNIEIIQTHKLDHKITGITFYDLNTQQTYTALHAEYAPLVER